MMQAVARGVASASRASTSAAPPCCRKVFVDMPNALNRSYIPWRGKSVVASVPSDSSLPSKVRKRVPKHERRAMVESFVEKYQATNAGKFPSVSLTQQQIGGSYYVIREILQELEYKSKFSPVKEMEEFSLEKVEENTCISSDARKEPSLTKTEDSSVSVSLESYTYHEQSDLVASFSKEIVKDIKVDKALLNASKAYESHITSAHVEKTCDEALFVNVDKTKGLPTVSPGDGILSDASTTHFATSSLKDSDVADTLVSIASHSAHAKSNITEDMPKSLSGEPAEDGDGLNEAERKDGQEFPRSEDLHRAIARKLEHEEASQDKSTVWGNLKSLAHSIINFWKNM